jgi:(p)ppGpp synthase/HD superfamily hydrolase
MAEEAGATATDEVREARSNLVAALQQHSDDVEWRKVARALEVAAEAHGGQTRDGGEPYILHPLRVALSLVEELGLEDAEIVCAALLHDVLEDDEALTAEALGAEFGERIGGIVATLTKPQAASRAEVNRIYFERLGHANEDVKLIKLADKLDNLRDCLNCPILAKRQRTATEARDFYLPLAAGLRDAQRRAVLLEEIEKAIVALTGDPDREASDGQS